MDKLNIIGGGLAGSEAAWQAAERGVQVDVFEMRPYVNTGAHITSELAELICSNSLGSNLPNRASGLLKEELRLLGSLLIQCADNTSVPAGGALAVDRNAFAQMVTKRLMEHSNINVIRKEITEIPDGNVIIASGPLTSEKLSKSLMTLTGQDHLFFFDAISPIIDSSTIDMAIAFRASRYDKGVLSAGDYLNCPFEKDSYERFINELINAETIKLKEFERPILKGVKAGVHQYFEGCLPIEVLAKRGIKSLAYGPLRPVGLKNPKNEERPYAVVQLRQDNNSGSLFNMVGFQTNLKYTEQQRIFNMIPGLENATFIRFGQMHRNTFIFSPNLLDQTLEFKTRSNLQIAGQITGIEGYAGNIGTGLLAGWNAARKINGKTPLRLPRETMLGSLIYFITHSKAEDFQPMKANFGILPDIISVGKKLGKLERAEFRSRRSIQSLKDLIREKGLVIATF